MCIISRHTAHDKDLHCTEDSVEARELEIVNEFFILKLSFSCV